MKSVNFLKELEQVTEYWSPRIVGQVNDQFIKVAKLKGDLTWHKHDNEDELFYIVKGRLLLEYENEVITLEEGDFHVVPKGTMHNPIAKEECWVALIETVTTRHTGDIIMEKTKSIDAQLA
ncbi:cupin domain-containing protein [Paremcibacter congregatus]|uniref:Cupin n=1 Tax=Paremcibacter congregatus TaxID=2043170 RepID=A0A2G4YUJ9_9PROT|nr:cupin domain-containing protein [Paremcibacter congregatus]PHZ86018.1 cupin [Paremcibacter congregatus]QDE26984.1 cupin domain-containing protein [Paremcibacter congregatus]